MFEENEPGTAISISIQRIVSPMQLEMKAVDEVFATMRHKHCKIRQEVNWSLRL